MKAPRLSGAAAGRSPRSVGSSVVRERSELGDTAPALGRSETPGARARRLKGEAQAKGRREARAKRYRLRYRAQAVTELPSVQACGRSVVATGGYGQAVLMLGAQGAGYAGLNTCSSVSACPVCSARVRAQRTREVEAAGLAWLRRGGHLAFLTLTLPHDTGDSLDELLDTVAESWRRVQQSKGYRDRREAYGLRFIRSLEVTHTRDEQGGNGWHPHLHVLLFLEVEPTPDRLADLLGAITGPWVRNVVRRGWRVPTQLDLQAVQGRTGKGGLLRYLTKVQDGYDRPGSAVALEMVRGDLKSGRRGLSRTPFEILEGAVEGSARDLRLWREYEAATRGVRVLDKTRGLYAELGVAELLDEQAAEAPDDAVPVAWFGAWEWRCVTACRAAARLLDAAELGGVQAVDELMREVMARGALLLGEDHPPGRAGSGCARSGSAPC